MKEVNAVFPTMNWGMYWLRDVSIFLKAKQPDQWKTDMNKHMIEGKDLKVYFRSKNEQSLIYGGGLIVYFGMEHTDALHIYSDIIDAVNSQEGAKQKFAALSEGIKKALASSDT